MHTREARDKCGMNSIDACNYPDEIDPVWIRAINQKTLKSYPSQRVAMFQHAIPQMPNAMLMLCTQITQNTITVIGKIA
ncbi:hypothetical protein J1614_011030 [Plenodomus biglobosus]|nr:hypothetical protein J1614_011030 [Plenodomus biglobosus]